MIYTTYVCTHGRRNLEGWGQREKQGKGAGGGLRPQKRKKLDYVLNTRALAADLLCRHLQELI
jgi:hypothetical protein